MTGRTRDLAVDGPFDLRGTVAPRGKPSLDPARRLPDGAFWSAWRTPSGPVSLRMERTGSGVRGTAWGPGWEHALDTLPALLGLDDDPTSFAPDHPALYDLWRARRGARIGRSGRAVDLLINLIPGQKVTSAAAIRTRRELQYRFAEMAPGPSGLRLPADPEKLAGLGYANLHNAGLERKRASTLLEVCRRANRIEQLGLRPVEEAFTALQSLRGIGPWTAALVCEVAWGWSDAIQVGDYWLPSTVSWVLAGEARADDGRMLELLEPFRPHRARVIRLITSARIKPPRFGPRLAVRDFRSQ